MEEKYWISKWKARCLAKEQGKNGSEWYSKICTNQKLEGRAHGETERQQMDKLNRETEWEDGTKRRWRDD